MQKILDHIGLNYTIGIDEAAFYGPKLDIQIKNVHGKEDTLITLQIDMLLAQRFGMEYVDSDGQKKTPYIIHRTSVGCYERTLVAAVGEICRCHARVAGARAGSDSAGYRPCPRIFRSAEERAESCRLPGGSG